MFNVNLTIVDNRVVIQIPSSWIEDESINKSFQELCRQFQESFDGLYELWKAANVNSATTVGEFLSEDEIDDATGVPKMQGDPNDVVKLVTEHLKATV